jgi:hypothetical protein
MFWHGKVVEDKGILPVLYAGKFPDVSRDG